MKRVGKQLILFYENLLRDVSREDLLAASFCQRLTRTPSLLTELPDPA
jgi:hypothetical protein